MVVDVFVPVAGEAPALVVPREAVRIDEHGTPCSWSGTTGGSSGAT
jgi:hypothetical protein